MFFTSISYEFYINRIRILQCSSLIDVIYCLFTRFPLTWLLFWISISLAEKLSLYCFIYTNFVLIAKLQRLNLSMGVQNLTHFASSPTQSLFFCNLIHSLFAYVDFPTDIFAIVVNLYSEFSFYLLFFILKKPLFI